MQEDLKKIREGLVSWTMTLARALETNSIDDVKELAKDTRVVECACDQLLYSLYELRDQVDEQEIIK